MSASAVLVGFGKGCLSDRLARPLTLTADSGLNHTRITPTRMLRRPKLSQGAATKFRILTTPKREQPYFVHRRNAGITMIPLTDC